MFDTFLYPNCMHVIVNVCFNLCETHTFFDEQHTDTAKDL